VKSPAGNFGDTHDRAGRRTGDILFTVFTCIAAFVLVTFSPLRRLRQPAKFFVIGFASGVIADLLSVVAMARGILSGRAAVFIVTASFVVGAAISLLASSESISDKRKDELVRKSDDQSWRA
jgi:predicted exporter